MEATEAACRPAPRRWPAEPLARLAWCALASVVLAWHPVEACVFIDQVVSFRPGRGAGYGQDQLPAIVLGPPKGGGALQGSLDVLSLGHGGEIVLAFDPPICDGPGPDFIVFENPFHAGSPTGPVFAELAFVAVSQDGVEFFSFPYDAQSWAGLVGKSPVYANPENGIDPCNPLRAGGDAFDFATVGLSHAHFVRVTDAGDAIPDPGNRALGGNSAGFDLDAIAVLHPCTPVTTPTATVLPPSPTATATPTAFAVTPSPPPNTPSAVPTPTPTPTWTATSTSAATATATASTTPSPPPSWTPTVRATVCPGLEELLQALFDSIPATDLNGDGRVSAADVVLAVEIGWCP